VKLVINRCYGGFSLSRQAICEYAALAGFSAHFYKAEVVQTRIYKKISPFEKESLFTYKLKTDLGDVATEEQMNAAEWIDDRGLPRNDVNLIAVVEKLGDAANGACAELRIIEIPDGVEYEIDDYDGMESVHETHRSWA